MAMTSRRVSAVVVVEVDSEVAHSEAASSVAVQAEAVDSVAVQAE